MKNKITLRGIRDGAMMTALTVIFMLLSLYVPFFSFVGMFISGIPLAALYARDGIAPSVCAVLCSVLILFAVTGNILSVLSLAVAYVIPGLAAGICLKKKYNFFYSVLLTGAAFLTGLLLEILMIKLFMGGIDKMLAELFTDLETMIKDALASLSGGNNTVTDENIKDLLDSLMYTAKLYFPSIMIISSLFCAYFMYFFAGFILKRLRLCTAAPLPFYKLRAPKSMALAAVLFYLLSFLVKPEEAFGAALYNIIFVIFALIAFCGLSFIDFKFMSVIRNGFIRAIIYAAAFLFGGMLMPIMINVCIIIGVLDSTMNFRGISAIDEENRYKEDNHKNDTDKNNND